MHEKQRSRLPLRWAKDTRSFKYGKMYVLGKNVVVLRKYYSTVSFFFFEKKKIKMDVN